MQGNIHCIIRIAILMYKIYLKNAPKCIKDTSCDVHEHDTRNKHQLRLKKVSVHIDIILLVIKVSMFGTR